MTTSDFFSTVESIFHDWNYGHPKILYGLIKATKPSVVVEIGTYRGYAAAYMARAIQENNKGKLHCVDNISLSDHAGKYGDPVKHWESNLSRCGVRDWAELVIGDSRTAPLPKTIDFAYIDGWHSYLVAKSDFDRCAERGADVICLDDAIGTVGPRQLVASLDRSMWDSVTIGSDGGLAICTRKPRRRVQFSQEDDSPGIDISQKPDGEVISHLDKMSKITGVTYDPLCLGLK